MNKIYLLSENQNISGIFDGFALNDDDLKQIALDNYQASTTYPVHVVVCPPGRRNIVRIIEGGFVYAEYHIFTIRRVS